MTSFLNDQLLFFFEDFFAQIFLLLQASYKLVFQLINFSNFTKRKFNNYAQFK